MTWFLLPLAALALAAQQPTPSPQSTSDAAAAESAANANAGPEEFKIFNDHPRLLVNARHLRLLRRERERKTVRFEQFHSLVTGRAAFPEPGFAYALHFLASEDPASAKQAISWALSNSATDLRQLALVFDWCFPALSESQQKLLAAKIQAALERAPQPTTIPAIRDRVFAAIAISDLAPALSESTLRSLWSSWWMAKLVPAIRKDRNALPLTDSYPLIEILHAIRANLNHDMRDNALAFFKDFPVHRVISCYPATFPASDNFYRIPQYPGLGDPDLTAATLSRAADLALVAYDTNALEHQFLQGWLIQDRFIMRSPQGTPYEFLWANPYQPGLSYHHLPTFFHDPKSGLLYLRSDWEESATWFAYVKGNMELFMDGKRSGLQPRALSEPLEIGTNIVMVGQNPMQWSLTLPETTRYFLVGFKPNTTYEIEVDDEELREVKTDSGGVLALSFPASSNVGVLLRESTFQPKP